MEVQIRAVGEEDFAAWVRANEVAFSSVADAQSIERERTVAELDRTFGAYDGDEIVGTSASFSLRMRAPGGAMVPAAGVTMVGVEPTHRRRGVNTAMMRILLDQSHERDEPLAALFASEGGIYGRYGYGLATYHCSIDVETDRSAFVRGYGSSGRVHLGSVDESLPTLLDVYARAAPSRPGTIDLDETRFRYWLHEHGPQKDVPFFVALHEDGGTTDAYAIYKVEHEWPDSIPKLELNVHDLQATSPAAYADMWRFLLDVDLVHRVRAWTRPPDEPLLHLLAEPRRLHLKVRDGLWLRLVDVPAALAARGYVAPGRVVFEVRDRFCPWNERRVALEAGPDGAACSETDADADLACDVNVLGAVYLGSSTFRQWWRAGQVQERRSDALARADAIFASEPAPWCPFVF